MERAESSRRERERERRRGPAPMRPGPSHSKGMGRLFSEEVDLDADFMDVSGACSCCSDRETEAKELRCVR